MKIKLEHNKQNVIFLEAFVFITISIVYVFIIKDAYGYMGFDGKIILKNIIIGYLFFIPLLLLGAKLKDEFFFTVWHFIFILYFFGQVIFFQFGSGSIKPLIANTILMIVLYFASFLKWNFKIYKLKGKLIGILLIVSLVVFIPIFIKYLPYIDLRNLLLKNIYETRLYFRNFDDPYFGYLRAPLSRVILPSMLIIGIIKRKKWIIFLSCFMIIFIFLVGALKSVFIGMFAAILFYFGRRNLDKLYLLLYLFLGLTTIGLVVYIISENTFLVNSFVRRILFIPPMIDNYYYEIFDEKPLFWSHNAIGELFTRYPLDSPINMYIGESILKKEGMSANVGLITEGFFSFNYIGVFIHSLFISFFFIILKQIKIKPEFFGITFVYIYYINTSFFTVLLLTHGLIFFTIYAYFFLNKEYNETTPTNIK